MLELARGLCVTPRASAPYYYYSLSYKGVIYSIFPIFTHNLIALKKISIMGFILKKIYILLNFKIKNNLTIFQFIEFCKPAFVKY